MWLITGTVPETDFPLHTQAIWEACRVEDNGLILPDGSHLPIARGTTALAATAILACQSLGAEPPRLILAGDCGQGKGSGAAYAWLAANIAAIAVQLRLAGLTFHYFYPDLDGHNRLFAVLEELRPKPILVADAGFMYVAKMSGFAACYDLFTPDSGELAFLADEKAPHPFYTRGFLLAQEANPKELISRALRHGNCAANMIVKGEADYILCNGELIAQVRNPAVAAMECIGGTGDIVTGFATAWLAAGYPVCKSCIAAARASRLLAAFCQPNPGTQAAELICQIPAMLARYRHEIEKPA